MISQVGSQIGVGKESDIYEAQTDSGEEVRPPGWAPPDIGGLLYLKSVGVSRS